MKKVKATATVYSRPSKNKTARHKQTVLAASFGRNPQKARIKKKVRNGQPLYKRMALHPLSIFMVLCVGVLIAGWSYEALADSYTVTAEVPAAPLTEGATITSPTDGTTVTDPSLLVSGTCPSGAYIKLYSNNTFGGVTFCQNDGTFSMTIDLYSGENDLIAEDFNVTNDQGPVTPGVTVDYIPPVPPVTPPPSSSSSGSTTETSSSNTVTAAPTTSTSTSPTEPPLLLTSNYQYETSPVLTDFTWKLDVEGGTPPYKVNVQWGDGSTTNLVFNTDPIFQISHHYSLQGYYAIKVVAVDKNGATRFVQLAARIVTPNTTGNISTTNTNYSLPVINQNSSTLLFSGTKTWLWLAWPSFIVVMVMIVSFWLGERQELHLLYKKNRVRKL